MTDLKCYVYRDHGIDATLIGFLTPSGDRAIRVEDGRLVYAPFEPGERSPIALQLSHWEFEALRAALVEKYDPPTESKALRDALAVERARVDRVLERLP